MPPILNFAMAGIVNIAASKEIIATSAIIDNRMNGFVLIVSPFIRNLRLGFRQLKSFF